MDTADSRTLDLAMGASMNPGPWYSGQPNIKPVDRSQGAPPPGTRVKHAKSGETGTVVGVHAHGHTNEQMPLVRWDGQPSKGFTSDQGYSLDSLTTP